MRLPVRRSGAAYNDALGTALTLALAPFFFGAIGWLVDRQLGIGPILMIAFGLFGAVAAGAWLWAQYQETSARQDEGKPWTRRTS